ncbi:hypothetical protein O181_100821 [Austropuccinia psidii MF-1]|uniref:Uncharacterized protein n=1 Tax=Austropuccinia psidii MF-1 TaxID=1389203 RepID=A0A9Q3JG00_9BASI|nr:hypothetical protein [Austropuccinia psidii MF-1]
MVFENNPTEGNKTTVERLVEENFQSSPAPVVTKKRKAKKLVFPGPIIQHSEDEHLSKIAIKNNFFNFFLSLKMTIGRGSKYPIQSDGGGIRSRNDPTKGKRKGKIPSGTESTQGSAISQSKVPEMPIISEPELKLNMRNSKRDESNSIGSDRLLHELV